MKRSLSLALLLFAGPAAAPAAELPKPLVEGMVLPESVAIGPDGKMYVSVIGGDKDGDGSIVRIDNGKAVTVVPGLDDPKGIAFFQKWLFIADKTESRWLASAISKVNLEIAVRSLLVLTAALKIFTCWSESVRVTSESNLARSRAST